MGVFCNQKRRVPLFHFPTYKITANSRFPGSKCQDVASKLQTILVKIVPKKLNRNFQLDFLYSSGVLIL
jgi:hypothetical protein